MERLDTDAYIELPECLKRERVVILDVETTGFNPKEDRIIEFAAIWIEQSKVVMDFSRLLNPACLLDDVIIDLTGITQREVNSAKPFLSIANFVLDLLEDPSVLVAYNSSFDLNFLRQEILRCEKEMSQTGPVIDPLKWVRNEDRGMKCNLGEAAARRGINVQGAHRALADCYLTAGVLGKLRMPKTLEAALKVQKALSIGKNMRRRR